MIKRYWFSAFLFLQCWAVCGACNAASQVQSQTEPQVYSVVISYLKAWQKGDYNTMYSLWDSKSRQAVTPEQLSRFLSVDITGNSENEVAVRQLLGGARQILRGRIASVVSVKEHPETSEYATADCTVQTTYQSLNGIAYARLLPDLLKQAKALDAQTKKGDNAFAVAMISLGADKPHNLSTTGNGFQAFTHGQDAVDKQGPYITLYLHQYVLVKEQGQWRIANAVTVSDQPPTSSD